MAGIVNQKYTKGQPPAGLYIRQIPVVVFNVTGTEYFIRIVTAFKFAENLLIGFIQHMRLYIQPSSMGHS